MSGSREFEKPQTNDGSLQMRQGKEVEGMPVHTLVEVCELGDEWCTVGLDGGYYYIATEYLRERTDSSNRYLVTAAGCRKEYVWETDSMTGMIGHKDSAHTDVSCCCKDWQMRAIRSVSSVLSGQTSSKKPVLSASSFKALSIPS